MTLRLAFAAQSRFSQRHAALGETTPQEAFRKARTSFRARLSLCRYPAWQTYLAEAQPKTLIVWGENDPFFTPRAVEGLQALLPEVEIQIFDAGHFALETHAPEIGAAIRGTFSN